MIRLVSSALDPKVLRSLALYQKEINDLPSYPEQVKKANEIWPSRKANKPFEEVKVALDAMCSGARRCCYCEDSMADEIEHIVPKNLFPDLTFVWDNYLYACGPCNGPKNNQWAIFRGSTSEVVELCHPASGPANPMETGAAVLINPREEDPFSLIQLVIGPNLKRLDFQPIAEDRESMEFKRAAYTIGCLRLNERSKLGEARREAYGNYKARLAEIAASFQRGESMDQQHGKILELKRAAHPTVWREIQRYRREGYLKRADPELDGYFDTVPQAVHW